MSHYTLGRILPRPFETTLEAVRTQLQAQGFGVLTEIHLDEVLRAKIGVEIPRQVILGACRPELAHEALQADPSIAAVLPCNVVVRALDEVTTVVEAFDPDAMVGLASGEDGKPLRAVVADLVPLAGDLGEVVDAPGWGAGLRGRAW